MNMLETLRSIRGADTALGMGFCEESENSQILPEGSKLFATGEDYLFFFVDGYLETVFCMDKRTGKIRPMAYNFTEFLKLICSCGSAAKAADVAFFHCSVSEKGRMVLNKIRARLVLELMEDPVSYVQTVNQVIDCKGLSRRK